MLNIKSTLKDKQHTTSPFWQWAYLSKLSLLKQLRLLSITVIGCFAVLVFNYHVYDTSSDDIKSQLDNINEMKVSLFKLRNNEKNFLLQGDPKNLTEFKLQSNNFIENSYAIAKQHFSGTKDNIDILENFGRYYASFNNVSDAIARLGMTDSQGLIYYVAENVNDLGGVFLDSGMKDDAFMLLHLKNNLSSFYQLKRTVKSNDFDFYLERAESAILNNDFENYNKEDLLSKIAYIRENIAIAIDLKKELGDSESVGLQQQLKKAGELLEADLNRLIDCVESIQSTKNSDLKLQFLVIAALSIAILLFLLANVFYNIYTSINILTVHTKNSHDNPCYLDTKTLYVPEFKQLGNYMNLMLEAREAINDELKQSLNDVSNLNEELTKTVHLDPLTGIGNRRHFDNALDREFKRAQRDNTCLSIIMIDIDHFKKYNDGYGHQGGDAALRRVANILAASLSRETDVIARFGGEEFSLVLPNTDACGAMQVANNIQENIKNAHIKHEFSDAGYLTVSSGSYTETVSQESDVKKWLNLSDEALYAAKELGRARHKLWTIDMA